MTSNHTAEFGYESSFEDGFSALSESDQIAFTFQAVREAGSGSNFPLRTFSGRVVEVKPKACLALLAYAYARGLYRSEEIERLLPHSLPMQFLSGGLLPSSSELIAFRRHGYTELQSALRTVLVLAGYCHEEDAAEEADRRLSKAVFFDSMDRDC